MGRPRSLFMTLAMRGAEERLRELKAEQSALVARFPHLTTGNTPTRRRRRTRRAPDKLRPAVRGEVTLAVQQHANLEAAAPEQEINKIVASFRARGVEANRGSVSSAFYKAKANAQKQPALT